MRPLVGGVLAVAVVFGAGCATRDWVEEVVTQREAEIDQRVAAVTAAVVASGEARARMEREQAERERHEQERAQALTTRMSAVERMAAEAQESSRVALTRADEALARAVTTDARLTRLWSNRHARRSVNSLSINFGFDDSSLDDLGKSVLQALVYELRDNPTLTVDLEGYADPKGPREYNLKLSRKRVEAVQRYLEEQGVERRRINAIARGPLNDPSLSDERKRRVVVKIMLDVE